MTADRWRSLTLGRPPFFQDYDVDCRLPVDTAAIIADDGHMIESGQYLCLILSRTLMHVTVRHWRYRFIRDVVSRNVKSLSRVEPIKYRDILELDKLVQGFEVHELINESGIDPTFFTSGENRVLGPIISATMIHLSTTAC